MRPRHWLLLVPVAFAVAAIALGKEAGWDLQNYHWYNPYALLNDRLGFDIAVAHHATYYNPLIDLPSYWLASHGPAWWVGAFYGALFGVMVALQAAIAYHVIGACTQVSNTTRMVITIAIALCGASGAGAILELGNTANDVPAAIGCFIALWLLLKHYPALRSVAITRQLSRTLLIAGACAGVSAGLKLTTDAYALGLVVATFITPITWRKRCIATLLLGIGMLCGFLSVAGWWFWRMWEYGRNPLFPYYNHWFHSPLLVDGSYLDPSYVTDGLTTWLLPWLMTFDSSYVSESQFHDARILVAYVLVPVAVLLVVIKAVRAKSRDATAATHASNTTAVYLGMTMFLFCFAAVSYFAWLNMFSVYRYLVPLEMMAPLLITLAMLLLPIARMLQYLLLLGIWLALQIVLDVHPERQKWDNDYVSVKVPPLKRHANSMVLISGFAPMAFVIPSFPREIRFLRVDGWTVHREDTSSGLARQMRTAVAEHQGPLLMLFSPSEQAWALLTAQAYGVRIVKPSCVAVTSNIAAPLRLCSLAR